MGAKKRYDSKHKVTRIFLSDYQALKRMSQVAGVSMAEALHVLIEHPEQLPMLDRLARPISTFRVTGMPSIHVTGQPVLRVAPVTVTEVNGAGAEHSAYLIKPKGVQYG
ncbi:hypothetical protein ES705_41137 [subsurface metagenome]